MMELKSDKKKYRDTLIIARDVLIACDQKQRKNRISQKANLSHYGLLPYLNLLVDKEFLEKIVIDRPTTTRGRRNSENPRMYVVDETFMTTPLGKELIIEIDTLLKKMGLIE